MNLLSSLFENKQKTKLKVRIDHPSIYFFEKMSWSWKCLRAGLVLTCLRTRLVSGPDLSQCFAAGDVQDRKCLAAGSV